MDTGDLDAQLAPVSGLRQRDVAYVELDVDPRVLDPVGAIGRDGHLDEPPAEDRRRVEPRLEETQHVLEAHATLGRRRRIVDGQTSDVHVLVPAFELQEDVVEAGELFHVRTGASKVLRALRRVHSAIRLLQCGSTGRWPPQRRLVVHVENAPSQVRHGPSSAPPCGVGPREYDARSPRSHCLKENCEMATGFRRGVLVLVLAAGSVARADDGDWVAQSNANAAPLLTVLARYAPETAAALGVEGHDTEVLDLEAGLRHAVRGGSRDGRPRPRVEARHHHRSPRAPGPADPG